MNDDLIPMTFTGLSSISGGPLSQGCPLAIPGFVLSAKGMYPDGEPSFEQWEEAGKIFRYAGGALHWWIGDWLNYGERAYGEKYSQAIDVTGFDYQTLRNDKWVAEKVELSRRRDNLSWAHHAEIAPLEPKEQNRLLEESEKEGLTSKELRDRVRILRLSERKPEPSFDPFIEAEALYQWLLERRVSWPAVFRTQFIEVIQGLLHRMEVSDDVDRRSRAPDAIPDNDASGNVGVDVA